jgi:hypothetical protein
MKVYIATSFVQKELAQKWRDALIAKGIKISHDWTVVENPFSDRGELGVPEEMQREWASDDWNGVINADVVWVLAPHTGGCDCWIEMGAAMMANRLVIVSEFRRTIFTSMVSLVNYYDTHEAAFDHIVSLNEAIWPGDA